MRDSAHGATELAEAPPLIRPVLTVSPRSRSKKSVDRQRLVRDFKDGRSPVRITAPRVGRLALYFQEHMA